MLRYLRVSDCKMQEGSLRFEAGISIRPQGSETFGNRVEVKNLNSMSSVVKAIEYEIERQTRLVESGGTVASQTMLWNVARGTTEPMRSKEEAKDYRYFPEPDLVPFEITSEWLDRVRAEMPELPAARLKRLMSDLGLTRYDASVLVELEELGDYFEACVAAGATPKAAANWVMGEVKCSTIELRVTPPMLAELIGLIEAGTLSNNIAKDVLVEMAASGKAAAVVVQEKGLSQISNSSELEAAVKEVLDQHAAAVADLRSGKPQAKGFLIGQVMRATRGKANPKLVGELLDKLTG